MRAPVNIAAHADTLLRDDLRGRSRLSFSAESPAKPPFGRVRRSIVILDPRNGQNAPLPTAWILHIFRQRSFHGVRAILLPLGANDKANAKGDCHEGEEDHADLDVFVDHCVVLAVDDLLIVVL